MAVASPHTSHLLYPGRMVGGRWVKKCTECWTGGSGAELGGSGKPAEPQNVGENKPVMNTNKINRLKESRLLPLERSLIAAQQSISFRAETHFFVIPENSLLCLD